MATFFALRRPQFLIFGFVLALSLTTVPDVSGQWVQTNGPYGGDITSIVANGLNLYAATAYNDVFRSTDSGKSWSATNFLGRGKYYTANYPSVHKLAVSGTKVFGGTYGSGLFYSSDSGQSWDDAGVGYSTSDILSLVASGNNIYVSSDAAFMYSTDNGNSWLPGKWLPGGGDDFNSLAVNGSSVFGASEINGLMLSTDNGQSWNTIDSSLTYNGFDFRNLRVGPIAFIDSAIIIGTQEGAFRSNDLGKHWITLADALNNLNITALLVSGSNLFVGTDTAVFRSTDYGATWTEEVDGLLHCSVSCFLVNNGDLFAATTGGIFRSTNNGIKWQYSTYGITASIVKSLAVEDNQVFAGLDGSGVLRTSDDGSSWEQMGYGIANPYINTLFAMGAKLFVGTRGAGIVQTTDSGIQWNLATNGITDPNINVLAGDDTAIFAGSNSYLFLSKNDANSWVAIDTALANYRYSGVSAVVIENKYIFEAPQEAGVGENPLGIIFRSSDGGTIWNRADSGITSRIYNSVNCFTVVGKTMLAATAAGTFRSTNDGTFWEMQDSDFMALVSAFLQNGQYLFAATEDSGVFISSDTGRSWKNVNSGLTDSAIFSLTLQGNYLYAGTAYAGVWRRPLSEMIPPAAVREVALPAQFPAQAYPNPFPEKTTIQFTASESGFAQVTVVNLLGQPIAHLFEGELSSGVHSFEWNAANIPMGTYFCLIQTPAGREVVSVRHE